MSQLSFNEITVKTLVAFRALIKSVALFLIFGLISAQGKETAEVSVVIHRSGPCSDRFLQLRNVDPIRYQSAVEFDPASVTVDPPNPTIPGCMNIIARNVQITRPLSQITAEVEIRVSNKPDLAQPTIPCGQGDQQCQCQGFDNTCLYCGFCRNLARQNLRSLKISDTLAKKNHIAARRQSGAVGTAKNDTLCECERAEPGVYDLEAQVCTPPGEQLAQHIPTSMQERVAEGRPALGVHTTHDNGEVVHESDVVFLAVKPALVRAVVAEVAPVFNKEKLLVSIALGITTRDGDGDTVGDLLSSVGFSVEVPESLVDPVTGLSGSGPSYMLCAIEALADGGVKVGLGRELALKLAAHTLVGAAKLVLETGKHPAQLKDDVQSPAGSSIYAMHQLERTAFRGSLMDAVEAACDRSKTTGESIYLQYDS